MLLHWIWFALRGGISDREKLLLLEHFSTPEQIYFADDQVISQIPNIRPEASAALMDKRLTEAESVLDTCARKQIHILTYQDAAYPDRLRSIADPPMVLYYKGSVPELSGRPTIAVVGTRRASDYGLRVARRLGYQIGMCGGVVVSGLAAGGDAMAMQGALESGTPVVGVLGCGADVVYPWNNERLYADVERAGCLLSEFPPGSKPESWHFPKRNRVISGMSCGVLVTEAPEGSGALITARHGLEQGRDVFVVPGNIDVPTSAGSNALLREGAIPVCCGWDVVSEYEGLFPGKLRESHAEPRRAAPRPAAGWTRRESVPARDKKSIDKTAAPKYSDGTAEGCTAQERMLLEAIGSETSLVDDVIVRSRRSPNAVLADLTLLQVKGMIEMLPGGRVRRK